MKDRVIKKYANRKMYDTETSKPITLAEIATLIAGGDDIQVIDSDTGEDLTTITLAQIILEQERDKGELKSIPILLQELIKKGRSSILEFIEKSLFASIETVSLTKERADEIIRDLVKKRKIEKSEAQRIRNMLISKAKESKHALQEMIESVIRKIVDEMQIPSRNEINQLKKSISSLNKKLKGLRK